MKCKYSLGYTWGATPCPVMKLLEGEFFMLGVRHRLPRSLNFVYGINEVQVMFVWHLEQPGGVYDMMVNNSNSVHIRERKKKEITTCCTELVYIPKYHHLDTCWWGVVCNQCGVPLVSPSSQRNRPSCVPGHHGPTLAGSGHSSSSPCRPRQCTADAMRWSDSGSLTNKWLIWFKYKHRCKKS